jgi:hypothetical protein
MSSAVSTSRPMRDWSGRFVALLGLAIALASLGYNTWRNETTEAHRNARQAGFVVLDQIAQFQQLVDLRFSAEDDSETTLIAVWGKAGLLRDLGPLVSSETGLQAQRAFEVWSRQADALDRKDPAAAAEMTAALRRLRDQTIADLRRLQ